MQSPPSPHRECRVGAEGNTHTKLSVTFQATKAELTKLKTAVRKFRREHKRSSEKLKFLLEYRLTSEQAHPGAPALPGPDPEAVPYEKFMPIGYLKSCFKEKVCVCETPDWQNGTPRQGSVCPESRATLDITCFNNPEVHATLPLTAQHSLEGLEAFSHVWILFLFHQNSNVAVKAKVRRGVALMPR